MSLRMGFSFRHMSPHEGAHILYESSEEVEIKIAHGNKQWAVPAALVSVEEIQQIIPDESYGGTMGGLLFITSEVPNEWRRFIAFHGIAEGAAPEGKDESGKAKHLQAVAVELGYAKATLPAEEFVNYLMWRMLIERSNFFKMDFEGVVAAIGERFSEVFDRIALIALQQ